MWRRLLDEPVGRRQFGPEQLEGFAVELPLPTDSSSRAGDTVEPETAGVALDGSWSPERFMDGLASDDVGLWC